MNDGERLRFQTACRLRRDDVAEVVAVIAHRIDRLLQRRGVMATSEESGGVDRCAGEAPALAGLAAASVQGLLALGPRAGARIARYGSPPQDVDPVTLGPSGRPRGYLWAELMRTARFAGGVRPPARAPSTNSRPPQTTAV